MPSEWSRPAPLVVAKASLDQPLVLPIEGAFKRIVLATTRFGLRNDGLLNRHCAALCPSRDCSSATPPPAPA